MTAAEHTTTTAAERMAALKSKAEQDQKDTVFKGLSVDAAAYLTRLFELSPGHILAHDVPTGCECPLPPDCPGITRGWLDDDCRQLDVLLLRVRTDRIRNGHKHQTYTPEVGFRLEVLHDALLLMAGGHIGSRNTWVKLLKVLGLDKQNDEQARVIETALLEMDGMEAPTTWRFPHGARHPRTPNTPGTVCDGPGCGGRADVDTESMLACFGADYTAHVATDDIYAVAKHGRQQGRATMTIDGKGTSVFGSTLVTTAYDKLGQHPGPQRVTNAASLIRGLALRAAQDRTPTALPVRATVHGDGYIIDLGDGQYVRVTENGWMVTGHQAGYPVMLAAQRALPTPIDPGTEDPRLRHLGFAETDPNWHQIRMWQATAFFADHERQLMMLTGGSGSGKTKRAQSIAALVDPLAEDAHGRPVLGGPLPDDEALAPELLRNYLFTSDNLTNLDDEDSDRLCRIATGYRFTRRVLYTTADTYSVVVLRAGLMTGIDVPPQLREDAQNRLLHLELDATAEKRASGELDAERRDLGPAMFGAMLDDMVAVLRAYRAEEFDHHDRFPVVACAARVFGPEYVASRAGHQRELARTRAEGDVVLVSLAGLVKFAGCGDIPALCLTATELYEALVATQPDGRAPTKAGWPTSPTGLMTRIGRNAGTITALGLSVERKETNKGRLTVLRYDEESAKVHPPVPAGSRVGPFSSFPASNTELFDRIRSKTASRIDATG